MLRGLRRHSAALPIACAALFVALGGSVWAATRIDGHSIRAGSLPGNRLVPGSLPGNRLRVGAIPASRLFAPGSITGTQVDAATLGQVPSAVRADSADKAQQAARALHADSASNAERLNGHSAGCEAGLRPFAGACWQLEHSATALEAPEAAAACAEVGGELPAALTLAAFAAEPGVALAVGDEWTGDLTNFSGLNKYGVMIVSAEGKIDMVVPTATKKFRCVIPLVS
jgi:hypothetical protein